MILAMGVLDFVKKGAVSLYVGVGFGLFVVSHPLAIAGYAADLVLPLVVGYMPVVLALYIWMKEAPAKKNK